MHRRALATLHSLYVWSLLKRLTGMTGATDDILIAFDAVILSQWLPLERFMQNSYLRGITGMKQKVNHGLRFFT